MVLPVRGPCYFGCGLQQRCADVYTDMHEDECAHTHTHTHTPAYAVETTELTQWPGCDASWIEDLTDYNAPRIPNDHPLGLVVCRVTHYKGTLVSEGGGYHIC